jgi:hypothetical protein
MKAQLLNSKFYVYIQEKVLLLGTLIERVSGSKRGTYKSARKDLQRRLATLQQTLYSCLATFNIHGVYMDIVNWPLVVRIKNSPKHIKIILICSSMFLGMVGSVSLWFVILISEI